MACLEHMLHTLWNSEGASESLYSANKDVHFKISHIQTRQLSRISFSNLLVSMWFVCLSAMR
jgi:hypothetical protein